MARFRGLRLLLLPLVTTIITLQCPGARAQVASDSAGIEVNMMNLTSTTTTSTTSTTTTTTTTTAKPDRAEEVFYAISDKMTRFATREFYPLASELIYDPRLSPGCIGSLMKIGRALRTLDFWAVEMIDAMGRPPAGMMQGRLSGYGAYEQCLAIRHDEGIFQGKYCMVHLRYEGGEMSPSVKKVVTKFANHLGFEKAGNVSRMFDKDFLPLAPLYKFGLCVPSLCDTGDLQAIMDRCYVSKAVRSFSLRRAVKKLTQIPNWGDYSNELGFIHGIRVLSATWVILGHSQMIRDPHNNSNFIAYFKRLHDDFLFTVQVNSFMAVETFLVITGFLSGYLVTKAPRVHLSPVIVIIIALFRRYVRLIVPMAALLGFMYLIPALVDGPALRDYWPVFEKPCTNHWWKIFTMTENYMDNLTDLCMPHYWYIAVDFQLAIVSTVILAAVTPRWPKASLWLMAIIAAATCLATGIQVYVKDALPFNIIITTDVRKLIVSQTDIYIKAHPHAAPLFIGVIFGCLATRRHRLSKLVQAAAWVLATALSLAALLGAQMYVSLVITAYTLASIMYLLVECPVAGLDNLVFSRLMPKETILKVMQGKATGEEVKYIEALARAKSKKAFDLASKQTSINGLPESTKRNPDDKHMCYTNGALNTDLSEDTQPNGAVMSVKF
ncbi:uncharacterized protein LOC119379303 [Rhipicephalus sanguineus]|uniref:uncharacterized protein LOC119379303 n=1 Tax=Rhipicephalus sanguineus TaxID=34632 RepID=UPI0020C4146B|nr:uncharacterized protein LOC119379303 [Rhipicephalus sanguineus]